MFSDSKIVKEQEYEGCASKTSEPIIRTLDLDLSSPEMTGLNFNRVFFVNGKIVELSPQ